jgi:hypothetical protein
MYVDDLTILLSYANILQNMTHGAGNNNMLLML